MENEIIGTTGGMTATEAKRAMTNALADKPKESDVLLQLLVFEHATDIPSVTVQTNIGELSVKAITAKWYCCGNVQQFHGMDIEEIREAIDKAVVEQFGSKPEPPYIVQDNADGKGSYVLIEDAEIKEYIAKDTYEALSKIAGKELPVVDASESQPTSVWTKVFPPETVEHNTEPFPAWREGYNDCIKQMQKETAFRVWRLTVAR